MSVYPIFAQATRLGFHMVLPFPMVWTSCASLTDKCFYKGLTLGLAL